jgi:hypothetical protein
MSSKSKKYILHIILLMSIIILGIFILHSVVGVTNPIMEGFDEPLSNNKADAFCKSNSSSSIALNKKCNQLTNSNCGLTSCCVWTSNQKCEVGGSGGPIFNSDDKGKTKHLDYYYYQNKCYGSKCP